MLNLGGEVRDHTEGVGQRVREKHLVIVVFKSIVPTKLVVNSSARDFRLRHRWVVLPHHFAESVLDIRASKSPSSPDVLCLLETKHLYRHSLLVKRVLFGEIDNVHSYFGTLALVFDSEKEPLEVTCGVRVRSEENVVII